LVYRHVIFVKRDLIKKKPGDSAFSSIISLVLLKKSAKGLDLRAILYSSWKSFSGRFCPKRDPGLIDRRI
jgi:hypothetical protein